MSTLTAAGAAEATVHIMNSRPIVAASIATAIRNRGWTANVTIHLPSDAIDTLPIAPNDIVVLIESIGGAVETGPTSDTVSILRRRCPDVAIVVISQTDGTPECSDDMVRWLPKTADVNSLAHALSTFGPGSFRSINRIRSRPLQVLRMLADGATVNEAAKLLGIAPKTAMNYLHETYQLLGVRNMTHAILAATRSDLLGYSIRLNPSSPPQVRKEV